MAIKMLKAAKNRAAQLEKQAHRLQAKIYDFAGELEDAGFIKEAQYANNAAFEIDTTQRELQAIVNH